MVNCFVAVGGRRTAHNNAKLGCKMKYTEEMDVELSSVPLTNGDVLPEPESLKKGSSSMLCSSSKDTPKSNTSNGLNGIIKYPAQNVPNGKAAPNSPTNRSIEEIGFEVESYSDFDSPLPLSSHSEEAKSVNNGKEHTSENETNGDINCDKETFESDKSHSDSEIMNDSSHLSEEFQLRLSDDEDTNLESAQNGNFKFFTNAVSSTTEDVMSQARSSSSTFPSKDGENLSGKVFFLLSIQ